MLFEIGISFVTYEGLECLDRRVGKVAAQSTVETSSVLDNATNGKPVVEGIQYDFVCPICLSTQFHIKKVNAR
jgi:hypothetical protein